MEILAGIVRSSGVSARVTLRLLAEAGSTPDGFCVSRKGESRSMRVQLATLALLLSAVGYATDDNARLFEALKNDDDARAAFLLEAGANPNSRDAKGYTVLMVAAARGRASVVDILIRKGADVNARNEDGLTALMLASIMDRAEIVKKLASKGAGLEAKNNGGSNALILAAQEGRPATVRVLLELGADINARQGESTALSMAVMAGKTDVVQMLLSRGASPNPASEATRTPLMWAALRGDSRIVKLLLAKGAQVNARDEQGATALIWTTKLEGRAVGLFASVTGSRSPFSNASGDYTGAALAILAVGADLNAKDKSGMTALQYAMQNGEAALVQLLKKAGATE